MSERAPLRYGVIVDRPHAGAWQEAVVRALQDGGDAELALVIVGHAPPRPAPRTLWRAYNNGIVARRARCVRPGAAWREIAPGVPVLDVAVERRGKWSEHVQDDDLDRIRAADLDFIVRFGLGIIRGGILDVARLGVWSFHHDDERVIRGGPPAFWEVYDGLATSGVLLQRLTDRLDGGVPLARATFRTVLHSYPRNRDRVFLGAASLPAQVARAVRLGLVEVHALEPSSSTAPVRRNPTTREMLRFGARQSLRAITSRLRGVTLADVWTVGLAPDALSPEGRVSTLPRVDWVPELKRRGYLADPFGARVNGRSAILVEEFDEASGRGVISALERGPLGWQLHSGVIDPGVHASYPYVVEDGGDLFCVPETARAGRVELWRSVDFPMKWERAGTLIDAAIVDPTVFRHDGKWWMLGTLSGDEPDAKLHAWYAPELTGPWQAHALNPLKIDVASSRPAGPPFVRDGVLYRPAQDCSTAYGAAVVLNRVVYLDDRGLAEEIAGRVVPPRSRYGSGSHTLAPFEGGWVIDGRRYGTSRHRFVREVAGRMRKLRGRR
ncbi:MAG TPA: hypothetical protein VFR41_16110 [Acidimicrobiia bacterium]|nr:hypothetical protein [Acidimicrobiia bacterium]